jgi:hypothetical protein
MPEGVALEPPPVPPPGRRIRLGYLSYATKWSKAATRRRRIGVPSSGP